MTSRAAEAARALFEAHQRRDRFAALPSGMAPRSAEEAYAIQDAFVALRAAKLGAVTGYKIALSSEAMRKFVGVNEPQAGMMHESTIRPAPARIRAADYVHPIVEFEIAVRLASDLPTADRPFFRPRVAEATECVMAAIEVADDRNADYKALCAHPLDLIADNAWNEGAILGPPLANWRNLDLATVRGVASINGKVVGEGVGAEALGHPFDAVAWVADNLASRGRALLRGDVVISGSVVTSKPVKAGDLIEWRVEGLGLAQLLVE